MTELTDEKAPLLSEIFRLSKVIIKDVVRVIFSYSNTNFRFLF